MREREKEKERERGGGWFAGLLTTVVCQVIMHAQHTDCICIRADEQLTTSG